MALTPAAYPVCRYVTLAEGTPRDDKLRKELMGALGGALGFQVLRFLSTDCSMRSAYSSCGLLGLETAPHACTDSFVMFDLQIL